MFKLDPSPGRAALAVSSLYMWNVLQLKLLLLCLLYSYLLAVLSSFGCPLMQFIMQNQLLIFLVLFLVAARCLVGQFDSAEQK